MAIPSPYLLAMSIGQEGVDEGEFSSPTGIALDKDGNMYVADTDNHSIQKFDKTGKFLARWGAEPSSQEGSFYYPRGLAVGPNDVLYVAEAATIGCRSSIWMATLCRPGGNSALRGVARIWRSSMYRGA
jgi:DNA-binding beta-propeller fold protein YncE